MMQSMPPMMPPTSGSMNMGGMPPQGFQSMPPQAGGPQGSMMPPMTNIPGSATIPRTSIPGTGMPGGVAMGAPPMSAASLQSGFQPGPMNSMPNMNSMPAMGGLPHVHVGAVPETLSSDVPMTDTEESWARATNENEGENWTLEDVVLRHLGGDLTNVLADPSTGLQRRLDQPPAAMPFTFLEPLPLETAEKAKRCIVANLSPLGSGSGSPVKGSGFTFSPGVVLPSLTSPGPLGSPMEPVSKKKPEPTKSLDSMAHAECAWSAVLSQESHLHRTLVNVDTVILSEGPRLKIDQDLSNGRWRQLPDATSSNTRSTTSDAGTVYAERFPSSDDELAPQFASAESFCCSSFIGGVANPPVVAGNIQYGRTRCNISEDRRLTSQQSSAHRYTGFLPLEGVYEEDTCRIG
ncbi:unnamed protein product [Symbiodinium sp. CCMP2592]|nr:unnamed protein product [Symbiodinium sp. CCMP2592]